LTIAEERAALQKRKQAAEQAKLERQRIQEAAKANEDDESTGYDALLDALRKGEVPRSARRTRPRDRNAAPTPLSLDIPGGASGDDAANRARDMLAMLKSDGLDSFNLASPSTATTPNPLRKNRRRRGSNAASDAVAPGVDVDDSASEHDSPLPPEEFSTPPTLEEHENPVADASDATITLEQ
jgi:cytokinesis protein